ncbi:PIN domain-containing protein [Sphingosinicella soli]|uniref:Ribonuclease VapC n=1 Tax=Sphingosinicella soli TaxID=333708 RepID=A0A7W7FA49_9SPHN|nr:PIN domain nuclease of toxin-antitoxin system [Sphingosinicella soli]
MADIVLDSSAVLAMLWGEPGGEKVAAVADAAAICANNIAEVATKLADKGVPQETIVATLTDLELEVHDVDTAMAISIGALRASTRAAGLSLGDRSCLALAKALGVPAITTDRAWVDIADASGVEVRLIR